jgi:hypothetical protein
MVGLARTCALMVLPALLSLGSATATAAAAAPRSVESDYASSSGVREVATLTKWQFSLMQPPPGGGLQTGTILVPGAWEAQGYGNETATMQTQVVTGGNTGAVGTYSKKLTLSPCSAPGASTVFMVEQGVHRHAIFKIGGKVVGEHTGYMTPFEHVLDTATAKDCRGRSGCEVEITVRPTTRTNDFSAIDHRQEIIQPSALFHY